MPSVWWNNCACSQQSNFAMKGLHIVVSLALLATTWAATLETTTKIEEYERAEKDEKLRKAVGLLSQTFQDWLVANENVDPKEYLVHLKKILEQEVTVGDDEVIDSKDTDAYGLRKKFKKWRKQIEKAVGGAVKAIVVNKVVGAAASALG